MFYAYPSRTLLSPSKTTQVFSGSNGEGTIVGRLQGVTTNNLMPIPALSATGTDYIYDMYNIYNEADGYYNVMTPNVNPYLMVVCPGAETSAFAIFQPTNMPFNGDTIWKPLAYNMDLRDAIKSTISANDPQMPSLLSSNIADQMIPWDGYFSFQRGVKNGQEKMVLAYTKYLGDFYLGLTKEDSFQYIWDKEVFKIAYAQEIADYNQNTGYWENYIPSIEVWHQPKGARLAMVAEDISPVNPIATGHLNGEAMVLKQLPNEYNMDYQMTAYFFYPLMYLDRNCTGEFEKLSTSAEFPKYDNFNFYSDHSTGTGTRLNDQMEHGAAVRKYGTPVWKLTFEGVPFQVDVDPSRDYFVAYVEDGGVLKANITNENQAREYYYNRPTIKNNVIFWSEPKADLSADLYGKDVHLETFLSCAFTQKRGVDTDHTNRYIYDSLAFRSNAYGAIWKTSTCPKRGNSYTATEVIPDPEYTPKGGTIHVEWDRNELFGITKFYVKDEYSYRDQIILDGVDMTMGVFQVLEMKLDPVSTDFVPEPEDS